VSELQASAVGVGSQPNFLRTFQILSTPPYNKLSKPGIFSFFFFVLFIYLFYFFVIFFFFFSSKSSHGKLL